MKGIRVLGEPSFPLPKFREPRLDSLPDSGKTEKVRGPEGPTLTSVLWESKGLSFPLRTFQEWDRPKVVNE